MQFTRRLSRAQFGRLSQILQDRPIAGQIGWVALPFAGQQLVRLATQIVLARMLAPEIFGVMLLVNTLRTGAELLSDIGIGQSVVRSPNGDRRDFLDVAWTLQVLRGAALTVVIAGLAWPIAELYEKPELVRIILAVSPVFLISGLLSPSLFLVQRHLELRTRAKYDLVTLVVQCVLTIGLAAVVPSVWALVWGLVASSLFNTVASFFLGDRALPRLAWHRRDVVEILHFGKWIFLATAIYFAASSFDRAYLVGALSLTLAGVFAIARTFSDMLAALAQRVGGYLVFPKVAAMRGRLGAAAPRLRRLRRDTLALVALVAGAAMALSDQFILVAYDDRYRAAAFMIPILLLSAWFGILSAFADSMLMGVGRPAPGAWANAAKFAVLLAGLPIAATRSVTAALVVLVLAEAARWLALLAPSRDEGLLRFRDDMLLTLLLVTVAFGVKSVLGLFGLVPSPTEWWLSRLAIDG